MTEWLCRSALLAFATSFCFANSSAATENPCRKGFVVVGETKESWRCGPSGALIAAHNRYCAAERLLAATKARILKASQRQQDHLAALEEWRKQSDSAVRQATEQSFDLLTSGLISMGAAKAETAAKLSRADATELQKVWTSEIVESLASTGKAGGASSTATSRGITDLLAKAQKWESTKDILDSLSALRSAIALNKIVGSDADAVERAVKGSIKLVETLASIPGVHAGVQRAGEVLKPVAFADFLIDYSYAAAAYGVSWDRIEQLSDTKIAQEAQALQDLQERQIAVREEARAARAALVDPGTSFPACPGDGG